MASLGIAPELVIPDPNPIPDPLFLERLEAFLTNNLETQLRAFCERERYPFEEGRRLAAEWHSRYLFPPETDEQSIPNITTEAERSGYVRSVLCRTSRALESLQTVARVQSFILAINPKGPNQLDSGFLGGTSVGRDFWRQLRGGGCSGAKAFHAYCLKRAQNNPDEDNTFLPTQGPSGECLRSELNDGLNASAKRTPASELKMELYSTVRDALRAASGCRNAEMKWSNHDRLASYGVRLLGWPLGVPMQNPSTLTASQNRRILDAIDSGRMRFIKKEEEALSGHLTNSTGSFPVSSSSGQVPLDLTEGSPASITSRSRSRSTSDSTSSRLSCIRPIIPAPSNSHFTTIAMIDPLTHDLERDPRSASELLHQYQLLHGGGAIAHESPDAFDDEAFNGPPIRLMLPGPATHYMDAESHYHRLPPDHWIYRSDENRTPYGEPVGILGNSEYNEESRSSKRRKVDTIILGI